MIPERVAKWQRAEQMPDCAGNGRRNNRYEHAAEDVGPAGPGAGAEDEGGAGDRAAGREPSDEGGGDVGGPLAEEVPRDVREPSVRVDVGLADPGALDEADDGHRQGRDQHGEERPGLGQGEAGEAARDARDVAHDPDRLPALTGVEGREGEQGQEAVVASPMARTKANLLRRDRSRRTIAPRASAADDGGPHVDPVQAQEEIEGARHRVREGAPVAGQLTQLAQDDEHRHAVQEAGHDRIGDEAQERASPEHAGQELDRPDQQDERAQRRETLVRGDGGQLGARDHRPCGRGGHVHEHRAGGQGGDRDGDHQGEDARHRVHRGEERMAHGLGHRHDREGEAGHERRPSRRRGAGTSDRTFWRNEDIRLSCRRGRT